MSIICTILFKSQEIAGYIQADHIGIYHKIFHRKFLCLYRYFEKRFNDLVTTKYLQLENLNLYKDK